MLIGVQANFVTLGASLVDQSNIINSLTISCILICPLTVNVSDNQNVGKRNTKKALLFNRLKFVMPLPQQCSILF